MSSRAKRATNITVDAAVLAEARALDLNVSQTCEKALIVEIREARGRKWLAENQEALTAWNVWVEENGLPLAKSRLF